MQVSTDGQVLVLAGESADSRCWYAEDNEEGTATSDQTASGITGAANLSGLAGVNYTGTAAGTAQASCGNAVAAGLTWGPKYPA